ncbi:MAG: SDR family NAD(P)-dependent oxidoreductase [Pseudomonadales bacterium]
MSVRQLLRKPFDNTVFAPTVDMEGKIAIVTGAGPSSLGYATAKTLAEWGCTVIVSTRKNTEGRVRQLQAELPESAVGSVDGHPLELSSRTSVDQFSSWYLEKYGNRLDALVNNAGIHLDLMSKWKQARLSDDGVEVHWRTNFLGSVDLTHRLLPALLETANSVGEARVVNVVSQLHSKGRNAALFSAGPSNPTAAPETLEASESSVEYNSWRAYGLSKLAMIHFSNELHRRYFDSEGLKSYSLHPGGVSGVSTKVAEKGLEGHSFISAIRRLGAPLEKLFMATAEEGAQTQIYCATAADARSGSYYTNCEAVGASVETQDLAAAEKLWKETAEWLAATTVPSS